MKAGVLANNAEVAGVVRRQRFAGATIGVWSRLERFGICRVVPRFGEVDLFVKLVLFKFKKWQDQRPPTVQRFTVSIDCVSGW